MAYLRNRAINWLNLHSGIHAMAQGVGGVFILVFLLRSGVPIPATLCAMALIVAGRFILRPAVLVAATRVGLKPLALGGTLATALQYPLLARVDGVGWLLLAYCLVSALGETFYWTCHHAYVARLGDHEHRGHQISAGVALSAHAGIVAPLVGAWTLLHAGPDVAFGTACLIQAVAALPLLAVPNLAIPRSAAGAFRASLPGFRLFFFDGWLGVSYFFVWQIALYLSLDASLSAYGGAMAFAALVGAGGGMLLGRHIDAGHGLRAVFVAFSLVSMTLIFRALSLETAWLAVAGNALGALTTCLLAPAQMTPVYNLAKASPCALRFHIAAEGGWDLGCTAACLLAALLLTHGASLSGVMVLGFVGVAGQVFLLTRYYRLRSR
jgi:MFS transporter, DHA1 family, inner membrane transport protein